jgi:hypothetical protein
MKFLLKCDKYLSLLSEQGPDDQAAAPQDAAAPNPNAAPAPAEGQPAQVAPEGYVNLVRLLAKALAMNIPTGELDAIYTGQQITKENAFEIQNAIQQVMKDNGVDNTERLNNIHVKKYIQNITPKNFQQAVNHLTAVMKQRDPYINEL